MNTRPTQSDLLKAAKNQWASEWFFMLPGKVETYNSVLQKADIQPLLRRPIIAQDNEVIIDQLQVLKNVPVRFTRGGGYFHAVVLEAGDPVTLYFCDQSTDDYNNSLSITILDPTDTIYHDINNAIAVPGWAPFAKAITADISRGIVIGKEGGVQLHMRDQIAQFTTGDATDSTGDFLALADKVDAFIADVHDVFNNWAVALNDGGGALRLAWIAKFGTPPSTDSVACTNVKADE